MGCASRKVIFTRVGVHPGLLNCLRTTLIAKVVDQFLVTVRADDYGQGSVVVHHGQELRESGFVLVSGSSIEMRSIFALYLGGVVSQGEME
jgi:hypothetical protein